MLQPTLLKFKKSKDQGCSVSLATTRNVLNFIAPSPDLRDRRRFGHALPRGAGWSEGAAAAKRCSCQLTYVALFRLMKSKLTVLVLALLVTSELNAKDGSQAKASSSGAAHYQWLCAGCHGSDGLASDGEAPPLAGSSWVSGPETRLIRIVMHGVRGPIQVGDKMYDREMPGVGIKLADREMAAMLSIIRRRWGASSAAITPEAVKRVRRAAGARTRYWTVEELLAKP